MVVAIITVCVLLLTPLRYYIPGYGDRKTHATVVRLKQTVDSLSDMVAAQQRYEENIRNVITGNVPTKKDTALLDVNKVKQEEMKSLLPITAIKKEAIEDVKKDNKKKKKKVTNE